MLGPLELDLRMVVRRHVGAGHWTQIRRSMLLTTESFLQPQVRFHLRSRLLTVLRVVVMFNGVIY